MMRRMKMRKMDSTAHHHDKYLSILASISKQTNAKLSDMTSIKLLSRSLLQQCVRVPYLRGIEPLARTLKNRILAYMRDIKNLEAVLSKISAFESRYHDKQDRPAWSEWSKIFEIEAQEYADEKTAWNRLLLLLDMQDVIDDITTAEKIEARKQAAREKLEQRKAFAK
jgi:hypothetical protein